MKILVTGANGYLGRGIVKKLIELGHDVVATDIDTSEVDEKANRIDCDLFSIDKPYNFFDKPDVLLHLAWKDGFIHYSESHILELPKHCSFIEKFAKSDVKKITVMGSMHEIGFYEGSIDENTPCNPQSFYGIAKNALRGLTEIYCKQNDKTFQWLRGFYIVGNSEYGSSIFSKIALAEKEGKLEFPFTTGQNQFDFIDYDEFCRQVSLTVTQDEINGIINICSGRPEKLAYRVEKFIYDNKFNIKLEYGVFPERPYDSKAVWGDNYKIKKIVEMYELRSVL